MNPEEIKLGLDYLQKPNWAKKGKNELSRNLSDQSLEILEKKCATINFSQKRAKSYISAINSEGKRYSSRSFNPSSSSPKKRKSYNNVLVKLEGITRPLNFCFKKSKNSAPNLKRPDFLNNNLLSRKFSFNRASYALSGRKSSQNAFLSSENDTKNMKMPQSYALLSEESKTRRRKPIIPTMGNIKRMEDLKKPKKFSSPNFTKVPFNTKSERKNSSSRFIQGPKMFLVKKNFEKFEEIDNSNKESNLGISRLTSGKNPFIKKKFSITSRPVKNFGRDESEEINSIVAGLSQNAELDFIFDKKSLKKKNFIKKNEVIEKFFKRDPETEEKPIHVISNDKLGKFFFIMFFS